MNGEKVISPGLRIRFELLKEGEDRFVLKLNGELDADSAVPLWEELKPKVAVLPIKTLIVDTSGLTRCDSAGLGFLYLMSTGRMTPEAQVTLTGQKPEFEKVLHSFSWKDYEALQSEQPSCQPLAEEVGTSVVHVACDVKSKVVFVGDVVSGLVYVLSHPRWIRGKEILRIFETAGVNALPIVSLISLLVGLIIAFESAEPLAQFGAQIYIANMIGLIMVRELGPVMTAILLAGRSGSAFAAELGTMKVDEELNALETTGLDPVRFLVVQRLLASLLLTPLLTIYSMFTGIVGGIIVMLGLGFPLPMIRSQLESSVQVKDVAFGTFKGFVFGIIVAWIACLRGLQTKSGPSAVGESTTRAVVSGILLIVMADSLFAVLAYVLKR